MKHDANVSSNAAAEQVQFFFKMQVDNGWIKNKQIIRIMSHT